MYRQPISASADHDDRRRSIVAGSGCRPETKMGREIALATLDGNQRYNIHHVCISVLIIAQGKGKVNV